MKSILPKIVLFLIPITSFLYPQSANSDVPKQVPNVVTADIQAGIEKYIEDETARGGGYFKFSSDGQDFSFKLVRVHTSFFWRWYRLFQL